MLAPPLFFLLLWGTPWKPDIIVHIITANHRTIRRSICPLMNISVKTVIMRLLYSCLLKNLKLNQKSNALIVKVIMCRKKSRNLVQKQVKNHSLCGLITYCNVISVPCVQASTSSHGTIDSWSSLISKDFRIKVAAALLQEKISNTLHLCTKLSY